MRMRQDGQHGIPHNRPKYGKIQYMAKKKVVTPKETIVVHPQKNAYVWPMITLALIFLAHLFFRFYNLENWASFTWDQVDNAWASAKIIVMQKYPLVGMVAKGNSGMYIGPLYYYLTALFYRITDLHPIASPILAAVTSLFSFAVLYKVTNKLFSVRTALWATAIYTFSSYIIRSERSQWPVNFIPVLSLLIFYYLYKTIADHPKYSMYLAAVMGVFFHIHFTAVFYPIAVLLTLPFLPFNKTAIKYYVISFVILGLFFIPQILYYMQSANAQGTKNYSGYLSTYYHGFHGRRVLQLVYDAFIKFQQVLEVSFPWIRNVIFFFIPVFYAGYLWKQLTKPRIALSYLLGIWYVIPWFVFATYKGEISDYYFASTLYISIIILAWLTNTLWQKHALARIVVLLFWGYYAVINTQHFLNSDNKQEFKSNYISALEAADGDRYIHYADGDPKSYMYYYHMYKLKKELPYKL